MNQQERDFWDGLSTRIRAELARRSEDGPEEIELEALSPRDYRLSEAQCLITGCANLRVGRRSEEWGLELELLPSAAHRDAIDWKTALTATDSPSLWALDLEASVMRIQLDPYWRLRPLPSTPPDELCSCSDQPPLLLIGTPGDNPLACAACKLEVPPETVGFDATLAQDIRFWNTFHNCFWYLWLDSGEFEPWALEQLSDPRAPVNTRGMEVVASLSQVRPTYLWWFQDVGAEGFRPLEHCPACAKELTPIGRGQGCEPCRIYVAN